MKEILLHNTEIDVKYTNHFYTVEFLINSELFHITQKKAVKQSVPFIMRVSLKQPALYEKDSTYKIKSLMNNQSYITQSNK